MLIIDLILQKSNVFFFFFWMCCLILLINLMCFADNLNTLLLIFCSLVSFCSYLKMHLILCENNMIYKFMNLNFLHLLDFYEKTLSKRKKIVFGQPWWPTLFQDLGPQTTILVLCPWPHKGENDVEDEREGVRKYFFEPPLFLLCT